MTKAKDGHFYRWLAIGIAVYFLLAGLFYWIIHKDWSETFISTAPVNSDALLPELTEDSEVRQTFHTNVDQLQQIQLHASLITLAGNEPREVQVKLLDANEQIMAEQTINVSEQLNDNQFVIFFPDLMLQKNQYTLVLSGHGGIAFWYGATRSAGKFDISVKTDEILYSGSQLVQGELVMSQSGIRHLPYTRIFWPVAIGFCFILIIIAVVAHLRRMKGKIGLIQRSFETVQKFRYLLKTLVIRDFKVRYKASTLGVLWSFLNPLMMTMVYLFVFSTLFQSSIEHFPVYLMSGIVLFNYFSEATNLGMVSIVGNAGLITKVYIPKYIFPVSKALSSAINLVISLIPVIIMMVVTGVPLRKSLLLIPILIVFLVSFSIGVSLILSACMVYFRDTQFLWGIVLTILNFYSPIFYPESIIPARFAMIYHLNPMYQFLFFMRTIMIGGISPTPVTYLYCSLSSLAALFIGLYVFKRTQNQFVLHL